MVVLRRYSSRTAYRKTYRRSSEYERPGPDDSVSVVDVEDHAYTLNFCNITRLSGRGIDQADRASFGLAALPTEVEVSFEDRHPGATSYARFFLSQVSTISSSLLTVLVKLIGGDSVLGSTLHYRSRVRTERPFHFRG